MHLLQPLRRERPQRDLSELRRRTGKATDPGAKGILGTLEVSPIVHWFFVISDRPSYLYQAPTELTSTAAYSYLLAQRQDFGKDRIVSSPGATISPTRRSNDFVGDD